MKTTFLLFLLLISGNIFGQKVLTIDFDQIKAKITDSKSAYYYPKLIRRFTDGDTNLTMNELQCIYYGSVFSEKYSPYGLNENEDKFNKLYRDEEYKKAIAYGKKALKDEPVNLQLLFRMLVCHDVLKDKKNAQHYADMYFPLLQTIQSSGDGQSMQTAYVVTRVSDEYELMAAFELQQTSQSLVGDTDVFTLDPDKQTSEPKIANLYFNVALPLDYLHQQFSGSKK